MSSGKRKRDIDDEDASPSKKAKAADATWVSKIGTGPDEVLVSSVGLGCMPLCVCYPTERPSEKDAVAVIHAALDAGVRYFDTADTYCRDQKELHYGETLVAKAIRSYQDGALVDSVIVATKGGMTRLGSTSASWRNFVSPASLARTIEQSAEALGGTIDLWQLHHPPESAKHTVETCMEEVAKHVAAGTIKRVGICNATVAEIKRASKFCRIDVVQDHLSVFELQSKSKAALRVKEVIEYCNANDIPFVAYGMFGGTKFRQGKLADLSTAFPDAAALAVRKGVSVHALVLAYFKARYPCMLAIPGARTPAHAANNMEACGVVLNKAEMAMMDALKPARGTKKK